MTFIYETLIIIAVAIFLIAFASLICFRDEHFFIRTKGIEEKHYILKKSRFLFLFALAINWNWKTGIIRKSTFWGTLGFYIYFLVFYIADMLFYVLTNKYMVLEEPIYWVMFLVISPIIASLIFCLIKALVLNSKNH